LIEIITVCLVHEKMLLFPESARALSGGKIATADYYSRIELLESCWILESINSKFLAISRGNGGLTPTG